MNQNHAWDRVIREARQYFVDKGAEVVDTHKDFF